MIALVIDTSAYLGFCFKVQKLKTMVLNVVDTFEYVAKVHEYINN